MSGREQPCHKEWGSLTLCVLLSLILHLGLAWALDLLPRRADGPPPRASSHAVRHVQVVRTQKRDKVAAEPEKKEERQDTMPFAKTSADERQRPPEHADFAGRHDSVASGEEDAPQRASDEPLPSMAGRESEEIVTFDQQRQDGDLAHEGKATETAPAQSTPQPPPPQLAAQGSPDGHPEQGERQGEETQPPSPAAPSTAAQEPEPPAPGEGLKLADLSTDDALTLSPHLPPPPPLGLAEGTGDQPAPATPPHRHTALYDPSLASDAQRPGLRTYERRTRSTGRFIFGRRPALNVAATPRGRYEAEIYRRIARMWYAACDEHRGDIIPGSITVSLRLTKSGGIDSMDLVRRRGASLSQQSFSFKAIRRAALPPMPAEVQKSIIGRLYEMILTFNFD